VRVGVDLVSGIVVGVLIGLFLDRWLETGPWLMLVFFVLGSAAGVTNVIRTARRMEAEAAAQRQGKSPEGDEDR
jgi:ATP synthase protein I